MSEEAVLCLDCVLGAGAAKVPEMWCRFGKIADTEYFCRNFSESSLSFPT